MVLLHLLYISTFTWSATSAASLLPKPIPYTEESPTQTEVNRKVEISKGEIYRKYLECGRSKFSHRTPRILNGREALEGEYPWMVSIQWGDPSVQKCGGSIVGPRHILTAAHCLTNNTSITVMAGSLHWENGKEPREQLLKVKESIAHENYQPPPIMKNDIAILILDEEIKWNSRQRTICLPTSDFLYGNVNAKAAGWGRTWGNPPFVYLNDDHNKVTSLSDNYDPSSAVLKATNLTIINNTECNERWYNTTNHNSNIIDNSKICAAASKLTGDELPGDTTPGDSGGPLMIFDNSRWIVVGITSDTHDVAHNRKPGVYTRVSEYLPWIVKHLLKD